MNWKTRTLIFTCLSLMVSALFLGSTQVSQAQTSNSSQCIAFIQDYLNFVNRSADNLVKFNLVTSSRLEAATYTEGDLTRSGWTLKSLSGVGTRYYSNKFWGTELLPPPSPGSIRLGGDQYPFSHRQKDIDQVKVTLNSLTGAVQLDFPGTQISPNITSCAGGIIEGTSNYWQGWARVQRHFVLELKKLTKGQQIIPSGISTQPANPTVNKAAAHLYQDMQDTIINPFLAGSYSAYWYDYSMLVINPRGGVSYIMGKFDRYSVAGTTLIGKGVRYFSENRYEGLYPFDPHRVDNVTVSLNPISGETLIYYPYGFDRINIQYVEGQLLGGTGTLLQSIGNRYTLSFDGKNLPFLK